MSHRFSRKLIHNVWKWTISTLQNSKEEIIESPSSHYWPDGLLAVWSPGWLADHLTGWLAGQLAVWLPGWLGGRLTGWLANWLSFWVTNTLLRRTYILHRTFAVSKRRHDKWIALTEYAGMLFLRVWSLCKRPRLILKQSNFGGTVIRSYHTQVIHQRSCSLLLSRYSPGVATVFGWGLISGLYIANVFGCVTQGWRHKPPDARANVPSRGPKSDEPGLCQLYNFLIWR